MRSHVIVNSKLELDWTFQMYGAFSSPLRGDGNIRIIQVPNASGDVACRPGS